MLIPIIVAGPFLVLNFIIHMEPDVNSPSDLTRHSPLVVNALIGALQPFNRKLFTRLLLAFTQNLLPIQQSNPITLFLIGPTLRAVSALFMALVLSIIDTAIESLINFAAEVL